LGNFLEYTLGSRESVAGALAVGPDGRVWFTDTGQQLIRALTWFGEATKVKIPVSEPYGIVAGPDHAIWFTEMPDVIGRIDLRKEWKN
ncbi:MAG TPA: Virginiamycin B lyase, partial [Thermoanaerobaculia bacterium]|nr:Virginiamycin B lyase [Thermoanaerobaculia bacterium]